jgi:hypothetical protein
VGWAGLMGGVIGSQFSFDRATATAAAFIHSLQMRKCVYVHREFRLLNTSIVHWPSHGIATSQGIPWGFIDLVTRIRVVTSIRGRHSSLGDWASSHCVLVSMQAVLMQAVLA